MEVTLVKLFSTKTVKSMHTLLKWRDFKTLQITIAFSSKKAL